MSEPISPDPAGGLGGPMGRPDGAGVPPGAGGEPGGVEGVGGGDVRNPGLPGDGDIGEDTGGMAGEG